MVILLLIPLIMPFLFLGQTPEISYTDNSVTIVNFKWSQVRRIPKKEEVPNLAPPPEMTAGNKNGARIARINNPQIPDPNEVVDRQAEDKHPVHAPLATMTGLAQQPDR